MIKITRFHNHPDQRDPQEYQGPDDRWSPRFAFTFVAATSALAWAVAFNIANAFGAELPQNTRHEPHSIESSFKGNKGRILPRNVSIISHARKGAYRPAPQAGGHMHARNH